MHIEFELELKRRRKIKKEARDKVINIAASIAHKSKHRPSLTVITSTGEIIPW